MKKISEKQRIMITVPVMAVILTAAAIYYHQPFWQILPLYVSLFVMSLRAGLNRFSFLLGGCNCFLYAAVYIYCGLYGSVLSALLIDAPLQILTFIRWKKHAYGSAVVLRKMDKKWWIATAAAIVVGWVGLLGILKLLGSSFTLMNTTATIIGMAGTILSLLAFVEYTYFAILGGLLSILLYIEVIGEMPDQMTYLIYSIYCFFCIALQFVNARKLYRQQQEEALVETHAEARGE